MSKKDLFLIGCVVAVGLVLLLVTRVIPALMQPAVDPADPAYVCVTAGSESRWFTLPEEEASITLRRTDEEGQEITNVIRFTPQGVLMESSSCANQDCVEQGMVTLANRTLRPLANAVLCLPNNVSIELFSADEVTLATEAP